VRVLLGKEGAIAHPVGEKISQQFWAATSHLDEANLETCATTETIR
jgi:hypothetical protein